MRSWLCCYITSGTKCTLARQSTSAGRNEEEEEEDQARRAGPVLFVAPKLGPASICLAALAALAACNRGQLEWPPAATTTKSSLQCISIGRPSIVRKCVELAAGESKGAESDCACRWSKVSSPQDLGQRGACFNILVSIEGAVVIVVLARLWNNLGLSNTFGPHFCVGLNGTKEQNAPDCS